MPYGLHSCVDGDLHLHSEDPGSEHWVVEAIWPGSDDYKVCQLIENWVTYTVTEPQNAWYVDGCSSFRITTSDGRSTEHKLHAYPYIRSGDWNFPSDSAPSPRSLRP